MSARMLSTAGLTLALGLGAAGAAQAAPQYNDYGGDGGSIRCESDNGRYRRCNADTRGGVRLSRQLSSSSCIQGRSWGSDRNGVWVSEGCRAEFDLGRGGGWGGGNNGGWNGGSGGDVVRCESDGGRMRTCPINGNRARLQRQLSSSSCIEGQSWGSRQGEVWVSNGCRAEFVAGRGGWGGGNGNGNGGWNGNNGGGWGRGQEISCESNNNRQQRCNVTIRRDARLIRQSSGSPCVEGQSWGWDRNGVWVSNGCRGRFQVN
ncbi:DUF3011 domain-containing protein [Lysobacter enzymogenes]|uniref:DUF3011 domain-containing protein n=1 Tax=Lysobacter enzymogenes TaxID=69 RepID=UPI0037496C44